MYSPQTALSLQNQPRREPRSEQPHRQILLPLLHPGPAAPPDHPVHLGMLPPRNRPHAQDGRHSPQGEGHPDAQREPALAGAPDGRQRHRRGRPAHRGRVVLGGERRPARAYEGLARDDSDPRRVHESGHEWTACEDGHQVCLWLFLSACSPLEEQTKS
jgi:hypothetical protein